MHKSQKKGGVEYQKKKGEGVTADQVTEQMRETAAPETMATEEKTIIRIATGDASPEFLYVPLTGIEVLSQVRSAINEESESFKTLMESIKDRGILEPLIMCPDGASNYRLLCGERRLLAARKAGIESAAGPVGKCDRVGPVHRTSTDRKSPRQDLNPIDQV